MTDPIIQAVALLTVSVASVTDLLWQRVPNWLTLPSVLAALLLHGMASGVSGVLFSLGGLGAGFCLLILFYALGGMGAGDVKLLAAVGALLGPVDVFVVFLATTIFGGIYAVALWARVAIAGPGLAVSIRNLVAGLKAALVTRDFHGVLPEAESSSPKLCYAVCIAAATVFAIVAGGDWVIHRFGMSA